MVDSISAVENMGIEETYLENIEREHTLKHEFTSQSARRK